MRDESMNYGNKPLTERRTIRMTAELLRMVMEHAQDNGVNVNTAVRQLLHHGIKANDQKQASADGVI